MVGGERLRHAIRAANLTTDEFADLIGVNPKTIGRWVTGISVPQRHNQIRIARALNLTVPDLWPDEPPPVVEEPGAGTPEPAVVPAVPCEVTGTWGSTTNTPSPFGLIATGTGPISVLILAPHPSLFDALNIQAEHGRGVRLLHAHPELPIPDTHPRVQVRAGTGPNPYQLIHSGQQMQLVIGLEPEPGPVLLTLTRTQQDGLFDRITQYYDALWDNATHHQAGSPTASANGDRGRPAAPAPTSTAPAGPTHPLTAGPDLRGSEGPGPRDQPAGSRPRLWPRRPT